jgi:hypothetical protein
VDENERWRIEVYRDKLRSSLTARFALRFHIAVILSVAILGGWGIDVALLKMGMATMLVRLPLAVLAAYGIFVLGIRAWLHYSGIGQYLDRTQGETLVADGVPRGRYPESWPVNPIDALWLADAGEGCLWIFVIVAAAYVLFYALGGYAYLAADAIFADIVLEMLLAAGLLRGVRRMQRAGWFASLWSNTWPSLAFSLCVAVVPGLIARQLSPQPATLPQLWHALHAPKAMH